MPPPPGVTVGALLGGRSESVGLRLELLAGRGGLERAITSPYIQKTGLALAGFHEYLKPGRVLIFGESEIRYLESLETSARVNALRLALTQGKSSVSASRRAFPACSSPAASRRPPSSSWK